MSNCDHHLDYFILSGVLFIYLWGPNTNWGREGGQASEIVTILQMTEVDSKQMIVTPAARFNQRVCDCTKKEKENHPVAKAT